LTVDLLPAEIVNWQPIEAALEVPAAIGEQGPSARKEHSKAEIEQALERHHWIVRRAALDLGVARNTLYRLMDKYGIHPR
jgi:transcriptional regulator of acetoin/glycerol metabolism